MQDLMEDRRKTERERKENWTCDQNERYPQAVSFTLKITSSTCIQDIMIGMEEVKVPVLNQTEKWFDTWSSLSRAVFLLCRSCCV